MTVVLRAVPRCFAWMTVPSRVLLGTALTGSPSLQSMMTSPLLRLSRGVALIVGVFFFFGVLSPVMAR